MKTVETGFRPIPNVKNYNPKKWGLINLETSEIINNPNGNLTQRTPSDEVSVDYKSYLYLNTNYLKTLIQNGVKDYELGMLLMLSCNLVFDYNLSVNENENVHTTNSIAKLIGQTPQSVKGKLNRLEQLGVIVRAKDPRHYKKGKVYIVNPLFLRRGKKFNENVSKYFKQILPVEPVNIQIEELQREFDDVKTAKKVNKK